MAKRISNHVTRLPKDITPDPHAKAAVAIGRWIAAYQAKYRSSRMDEPLPHDAPEVHLGWAVQRSMGELLLRSAYLGHRKGVIAALAYNADPTVPVRSVVPLREAILARNAGMIADMLAGCTTYEQRLQAVLFLLSPGEPRQIP